jgi:alpha,alpha-trehalose phosphorylase
MLTEERSTPPESRRLVEKEVCRDRNIIQETLFALGNGYIGVRGSHEEGFAELARNSVDATFLNGFYESGPIAYSETAYAWPTTQQFMIKVPNGKCINFSIEGEEFNLFQGEVSNYERSVDFHDGVLTRELVWTSPSGRQVAVKSRRIVSFKRKNLFAIEYEIRALNFSGLVALNSTLDSGGKNHADEDEPLYGPAVSGASGFALRTTAVEQREDFVALVQRTHNSGFAIVTAVQNELTCEPAVPIKREFVSSGRRLEQRYQIEVQEGGVIRLTKYVAYFTSREHPEQELMPLASNCLKEAASTGFTELCAEQKDFLANFWHYAAVEISGEDAMQQGIRFNQFHLLQSVGRDGLTSVAAKGLTGEGYGGHYFWDAESYAFPFYLYTQPQIAKSMLEYRYSTLDKARDRARQMSHAKGALFAWRTIGGDESSSYFPAGTAQYHINADVTYAVKQYYEATGDDEFMARCGAEMVMETARIWIGIGNYVSNKGNCFCINGVTGPDEYTAMVNNNFYTNAMAQMHLRYAVELAESLQAKQPKQFERIALAIDLSAEELCQWKLAADAMYLPYDEAMGIHPQDDSFLSKKIWNLAETPPEQFPLALHHHYLVIYRHQVCKQADVLLAMFTLGDRFSRKTKKLDFDYYEAITTHDSSLSRCTFSIMASEVGYRDKAYKYFADRVRGDIDNQYSDTAHGVHIAAMSGNWMCIAYGFGGMRAFNGKLQFSPYLPRDWKSYSFRVYFKSHLVVVEVDEQNVTYRLLEGDDVTFDHHGEPVHMTLLEAKKVLPHRTVEADLSSDEGTVPAHVVEGAAASTAIEFASAEGAAALTEAVLALAEGTGVSAAVHTLALSDGNAAGNLLVAADELTSKVEC